MSDGEHAATSGRWIQKEVIGPDGCPILHRWTIWPWGEAKHENHDVRFKLLLHHFLPNADDRAVHDHPRPFLTVVLKGGYDDMQPCRACDGLGIHEYGSLPDDYGPTTETEICLRCNGTKVELREQMRAGMVRHRPAEHKHRTKVLSSGCWTVVVMGPIQRKWGFWVGRDWLPWRVFEQKFGHGMRCD